LPQELKKLKKYLRLTNVDLILEEDVESEPEITDEEIIAIQNTSVTTRAKPVISKKREKNSQNKQESEAKDYPPLDLTLINEAFLLLLLFYNRLMKIWINTLLSC